MVSFSFGVILISIVSMTNAQWRQDMFTNAENRLRTIVQNGQTLLDFVYQERMKHSGGNATRGGTLNSLNVAYSSFINDVEARLADMEQATAELVRIMRTCPDAPLGKFRPCVMSYKNSFKPKGIQKPLIQEDKQKKIPS